MIKKINRKLIFNIIILTILYFVNIPVLAAELEFKNTINTNSLTVTRKTTDYEFLFFDEDNKPLNNMFSISGTNQNTLKSGDTISLAFNKNITISDLDIGTHYKIVPFNIPAETEIDQQILSGVIENESNIAQFSSLLSLNLDVYPYVFVNNGSSGSNIDTQFQIKYLSGNTDGFVLNGTSLLNTGNGFATFNSVSINRSGTYEFLITQTTDNDNFVIDRSEYKIVIEAEIIPEYSSYTITYYKDGEKVDYPIYENTPKASEISYSPKIRKIVTGNVPSNKEFTFKLRGENNVSGYKLPEQTKIIAPPNKESYFDPITFSQPGSFNFEILEEKGNFLGYTFDETVWNLKVDVKTNQDTSELEIVKAVYANGIVSEEDEAVFNNIYNSGSLSIEKTVKGKTNVNDTFKIRIHLKDQDNQSLAESFPCNGNIRTVKDGDEISIKNNQTITISQLPTGTQYSIEEIDLPPGYTVEYQNSQGEIDTDQEKEIKVVNTYKPNQISYPIQVQKLISGSIPQEDKEFKFTLDSEINDGIILPSNKELSIYGSNVGNFDPIVFTKEGNYKVYVSEQNLEYPGYTFDNTQWEVNINIIDNNSNLEIDTITYSGDNDESNNEKALFRNIYSVNAIEVPIVINKEITGNIPEELIDFEFDITADKSNPEGFNLKNNGLSINSKNLTAQCNVGFVSVGTYKFLITEKDNKKSYLNCDSSTWICQIDISDVNALLVPKVTYYLENNENNKKDVATFVNQYKAQDLELSKSLINSQTTQNFQFKIELFDQDNNPLLGTYPLEGLDSITTVTNNSVIYLPAQKIITIKDLPEGTNYKLTEENIALGFTPTQNPIEGKINNNKEEVNFINSYQPRTTLFTPAVSKEVIGETTGNKEFSFRLTGDLENPEDGDDLKDNLVGKVTNSGKATFTPITYNKEGNYKYYLNEINSNERGYTYDEAQWTINVTVEDHSGQLTVTKTEYTSNFNIIPQDEAKFTNIYQPLTVSYTPKVKKIVTGITPVEKLFTFQLSALEENDGFTLPPNTQLQILGNGENTFDAITFSKAGNYIFSISEDEDNYIGYTFDTSVWNLEISVEDNNGQLRISNITYSISDEPQEQEENTISQEEGGIPSSDLEEISVGYLYPSKALSRANILYKELPNSQNNSFFQYVDNLIDNIFGSNEAYFNNTFSSGNLKITKQVIGDLSDQEEEFHFQVFFKDNNQTIEDYFSYSGDRSGIVNSGDNIALKSGESIVISALPENLSYEITELESNTKGYSTVATNEIGIIEGNKTIEVEFVNQKTSHQGSITISKVIEGLDTGRSFDFYLNIYDKNGDRINTSYQYSGSHNGVIGEDGLFSLKNNESITITGIPLNSKYEVSEEQTDEYSIESTNSQGIVLEQTKTSFKNIYGVTTNTIKDNTRILSQPQTGDIRKTNLIVVALLALGVFILVLRFIPKILEKYKRK